MPIVLSDVTFAYPYAAKPLILNLSLTFGTGWTCLLGDNGCGKTTLVKLAAGLLEPQQGSIQRSGYVAWCPQAPTIPSPEASAPAWPFKTTCLGASPSFPAANKRSSR